MFVLQYRNHLNFTVMARFRSRRRGFRGRRGSSRRRRISSYRMARGGIRL